VSLISLGDVRIPIFAVSTTTDHIAPWRSVYKIHWLSDADVTFVLTTGGHNAGIVSPPGKAVRQYRIAHKAHKESALDADVWYDQATRYDGSWWPAWQRYLETSSSQGSRTATEPGSPDYPVLSDAPGGFVREA
jgi:polyhydroxyalkanoate synthase subunit PhaC